MHDKFIKILVFSPSAVRPLPTFYPSAVRPLPFLNPSAIRPYLIKSIYKTQVHSMANLHSTICFKRVI